MPQGLPSDHSFDIRLVVESGNEYKGVGRTPVLHLIQEFYSAHQHSYFFRAKIELTYSFSGTSVKGRVWDLVPSDEMCVSVRS